METKYIDFLRLVGKAKIGYALTRADVAALKASKEALTKMTPRVEPPSPEESLCEQVARVKDSIDNIWNNLALDSKRLDTLEIAVPAIRNDADKLLARVRGHSKRCHPYTSAD